MKSSTPVFALLSAVFFSSAALSLCASADPLLTKAEIREASLKIEACLAIEDGKDGGKAANCVGVIKGPCEDAISAGGEAAHATCSDNETAAWDLLLNKIWGRLPQHVGPRRFDALKQVQKLWLNYRAAKCAFVKDIESLAWGLMLSADCKMDDTASRTIELRNILTDPNFAGE